MQLRSVIGTAVFCAVVAFITAQMHGGFMLIFVAPFLTVWLAYSAYVAWKHPDRRMTQSIRAGLWVLAVGGVLLLHWHYHRAARDSADLVVAYVNHYKTNHGSFPETIDAAGLNNFRNKWRISYLMKDGKPSLFYPATFVIFDTYWYDFEHQSWVYQPD